jgi:hypothetical protein
MIPAIYTVVNRNCFSYPSLLVLKIKNRAARYLLLHLLCKAEAEMAETFDRRLSERVACLNFLLDEAR